ncbi:hypothetical protein SUGI_0948950 [Cryptomeria japonica]|nr:hypothetical protein SUGI_0948950 [Cryptomeria japonica]
MRIQREFYCYKNHPPHTHQYRSSPSHRLVLILWDSSHDILPRVLSFYHQWTKIYGSTFLLWFGPIARTNIADPQLVQEIFSVRSDDYEKIEANNARKKLEAINLIAKLSFGFEEIIQNAVILKMSIAYLIGNDCVAMTNYL